MHAAVRQIARLGGAVMAVALLTLPTGCSSQHDQRTITQRQASARVQQLLLDTANSVTPRPRLEPYKPGSDAGQCLAGNNDPRSQVSRTYFLRGVRNANASISRQVLQLWKKDGYTITDTHEVGGRMPAINGTTRDDFLIELAWTGSGDLSIVATSPCLWPNGTPPPGQ